jgi:hypothetical protein
MKLKIILVVAVLSGGVFGHAAPKPEDDVVFASRNGDYTSRAATPLAAAVEYLKRFGDELKIKPGLLRSNLPPANNLIASVGEEYRLSRNLFYQENKLTQIIFSQTYFGLPANDGKIEVGIGPGNNGSWKVLYASAQLQVMMTPEVPAQEFLSRLQNLDVKTFARILGLSDTGQHSQTNRSDAGKLPRGIPRITFEVDPATIKIHRREWIIYRYNASGRVLIGSNSLLPSPRPNFPLPAVAKGIQEHHQYVVMRITFGGGSPNTGTAQGYVYIEPETLSVLYLYVWQ